MKLLSNVKESVTKRFRKLIDSDRNSDRKIDISIIEIVLIHKDRSIISNSVYGKWDL